MFRNNILFQLYSNTVILGAISGGLLSGINKCAEIWNEPDPIYILPIVEIPIRGVYQTSRIAGHAVMPAIAAVTLPMAIPIHIFMMK